MKIQANHSVCPNELLPRLLERKEILTSAAIGRSLEGMMLREISQSPKDKFCRIRLCEVLRGVGSQSRNAQWRRPEAAVELLSNESRVSVSQGERCS